MDTHQSSPAPERKGAVVTEAVPSASPEVDGLTPREAARALGMSLRQVAALIEAGVIVPVVSARTGGNGSRPWSGGAL